MENQYYAFDKGFKVTKEMQFQILALLTRDEVALKKYKSIVSAGAFTKPIHQDIFRTVCNFVDENEVLPSRVALENRITIFCDNSPKHRELKQDYLDEIEKIYQWNPQDKAEIEKIVSQVVKYRMVIDSLIGMADEFDPNSKSYGKHEGDIEYFKTLCQKAVDDLNQFDATNERGLSLSDSEIDNFFDTLKKGDTTERIPTGMTILDKFLRGGVGRGELFLVIAPHGKGKSTTLINMGVGGMVNGYKVLHISLENDENQVMSWYLSALFNKPNEYLQENADLCKQAFKEIKSCFGDIRIKRYDNKSITVEELGSYIQNLKSNGWEPDLVVVDYGMLLKPSRHYNDKRNGIEDIYDGLRYIATHYNCAVVSAAQTNRGGMSKKVVSTEDLAECFALGNMSDECFALCQTAEEKEQQIMRGYLAKNRGNTDGVIFKGTIDYSNRTVNFTDLLTNVASKQSNEYDETNVEDWEE